MLKPATVSTPTYPIDPTNEPVTHGRTSWQTTTQAADPVGQHTGRITAEDRDHAEGAHQDGHASSDASGGGFEVAAM
ncbi:hypothetical protein SAMN05421805_102454 [Saccharopolyspora antimicrobica]|uniref:Uncharacterized protein n=1 Tax=Saccharopolyspora antimicrobica TaxID=455193 RepID=A0A1I4VZL4_9PSEU|nr:hypothetical protein SAMN05421805_102454 [Saccharopolyspora antimicrobica]